MHKYKGFKKVFQKVCKINRSKGSKEFQKRSNSHQVTSKIEANNSKKATLQRIFSKNFHRKKEKSNQQMIKQGQF